MGCIELFHEKPRKVAVFLQQFSPFAFPKTVFLRDKISWGEIMAYEKRLCILKQVKKGFTADGAPLTGAVYAERLGEELTVTPRIAGLAPVKDGRYALALWAGGKSFCLELKGNEPLRIPDAPSISSGFSAIVCFVRSGSVEPVAHGTCGSAPADFSELLTVFEKRERKTPVPVSEKEVDKADCFRGESVQEPFRVSADNADGADEDIPGIAPSEDVQGRYDDEAIASTDYFDGVWKTSEDAGAGACGQDEEKAAKDGCGTCADEAGGALHPFRLSRGSGLTYYNEIAGKLHETMKKYPRDETLTSVFPHSEWVKTETALLGIIYAEGLPRYLCVGMKEAPEAYRGVSVFVPVNHFTETEGYYIVFQDADTGEYVKVENS